MKRITVLLELQASREHYCVHKRVSKAPNRDEECEKLLRDQQARPAAYASASSQARLKFSHYEPHADRAAQGCKYFKNANKLYGQQTSASLHVRTHYV